MKNNNNESYNPRLKALILEVVDNQIRDNTPPITAITLKRLMDNGYSRQQAKEMIGSVVAGHIFYIMHDEKPFDEEAYTHDLLGLK